MLRGPLGRPEAARVPIPPPWRAPAPDAARILLSSSRPGYVILSALIEGGGRASL